MLGSWPLVGRGEELDFAAKARRRGRRGLVLSGAAGVGKTRLAAEACEEARADGWAAVEVRATPGMSQLAMAVFATALGGLSLGADPAQLAAAADALLDERAAGRPLVLSVDDGHLLDELSAGFVFHVANSGRAFVVVTVRTGEERPEAITSLWKDDLAERLEVEALSRDESASLLGEMLEGSPDAVAERRLWVEAQGNPLFVRELVLAGIESGSLVEEDGAWRWRGGGESGGRLTEVVDKRLRRLDDDERAALELVALAGAIDFLVLSRLTSNQAIDSLELAGMVRVEHRGRRREVSVTHPIYAEVLRAGVPRLRARALYRQLADSAEAAALATPSARIQIAIWRLEQGAPVDPATLVAASHAARWSVAEVHVERLQRALSVGVAPVDAPVADFAWRPGVGDPALAVRLARTAWEADGSSESGMTLALTLVAYERVREATDVLAELEASASEPLARARLAIGRAALLQYGRGQYDAARVLLLRAEGEVAGLVDPLSAAVMREVICTRAGLELNAGEPAAAVAVASTLLGNDVIDVHRVRAAAAMAGALAQLGRAAEAIALVDHELPFAMGLAQESALPMGELLFSRGFALLAAGRLHEGMGVLRAAYDVALSSEVQEGASAYSVALARGALLQGRPATALRYFREASAMFAERDAFSYAPWAAGGVARSLALLGERDAASEARRSLRALREEERFSGVRFFDVDLLLDEHEVLLLDGSRPAAIAVAEEAVTRSEGGGMAIHEALARHRLVRTLPPDATERRIHRDNLADLATRTEGVLVSALAAHAGALIDRDGSALDDAAAAFDAMGARLLAAESYADAARCHERHSDRRHALASARRSEECSAGCERARTAPLDELAMPATLTTREREIALLAAAGLPSKEIASRLIVSVRTVDSHLARVYVKLGITTRAELATVLGHSSA
jgi:DNA-binding CsgD family transcriptional regulator/tetratricopeptide (TPR) repeat protein